MRKIIYVVLMLSFALAVKCQSCKLIVKVDGFSSGGRACVCLFEEGQKLSANSKVALKAEATIRDGYCEFIFENLPVGEYAAIAYHDQNGNGILDTNMIGFPKEGVGNSNSYKGMPSFKKMKLLVDKDQEIAIHIVYM